MIHYYCYNLRNISYSSNPYQLYQILLKCPIPREVPLQLHWFLKNLFLAKMTPGKATAELVSTCGVAWNAHTVTLGVAWIDLALFRCEAFWFFP
jgi:hypothetical protein